MALVLSIAATASALPNDRAYEMVTPPVKPDEPFQLGGMAAGVTDAGDHFFYSAAEDTVADDGSDLPQVVRVDRGTDGWRAMAAMSRPPVIGSGISELLAFSNDASIVVGTGRRYDPMDQAPVVGGDLGFYRFDPFRNWTFLSPDEIDPTAPNVTKNFLASAPAADGRRIVFDTSEGALLPVEQGRQNGSLGLYEFRDGVLTSAGVGNDGTLLTTGDTRLGSYYSRFNAYSTDGSRLFFTAYPGPGSNERPGLYVRLDGSTVVPIPDAANNASSTFLGATPDGRKVFFSTPVALTPDDTDSSPDLYAYDTDTSAVTRITPGSDANVTNDPVWASNDGERVYFTATGQLVPGFGGSGRSQTYVYDHGVVKYVADSGLMTPVTPPALPQCGTTRITPDGRYLLAETPVALTPDDQDGGQDDVYRYDAVTGKTIRVSTGPLDDNGAQPAMIDTPSPAPPFIPSGCDPMLDHVHHSISDDGRFVFFTTAARLVRQDDNGKNDVYEWDATTGETSLISTGRSTDDSNFLDATPSGDSVFFTTREPLVAADRDAQVDIYGARIGGGFPEAAPAAECHGADCQGPGGSPPQVDTPGSVTSTGSTTTATRRGGVLAIRKIPASAARRLLATGRLRIRIVAAFDGRITVSASIGTGARRVVVGRAVATGRAGHASTVTLRLTRAATRMLGRHATRLRIVARQPGADDAAASLRVGGTNGARR